jgi:hypothetical protein
MGAWKKGPLAALVVCPAFRGRTEVQIPRDELPPFGSPHSFAVRWYVQRYFKNKISRRDQLPPRPPAPQGAQARNTFPFIEAVRNTNTSNVLLRPSLKVVCDMAHWQLSPVERAQRGARWWCSEGNQPFLSGRGVRPCYPLIPDV